MNTCKQLDSASDWLGIAGTMAEVPSTHQALRGPLYLHFVSQIYNQVRSNAEAL
jgi:hypothetical protein